jgi:hypothetical protein
MEILIKPTNQVVYYEGRECRVWDGVSKAGVPCFVLVCSVAVEEGSDMAEFAEFFGHEGEPGAMVALKEAR